MSQKCDRCAATLSKNAKFCTVCGKPVSASQVEVRPVSRQSEDFSKCQNCGKILRGSEKFCTKCGATVIPVGAPPTAPSQNTACTYCGFANNPVDSNYCINCGQALSSTTSSSEEPELASPSYEPSAYAQVCTQCHKKAKAGSKFCVHCGSPLTTDESASKAAPILATEPKKPKPKPELPTASVVKPLPIPVEVLASLMARGRQIKLEEEYAKNGTKSDKLLDELSEAAGDSDFEVEELIDSYVNEQAELDRLKALHEKSEVSDRVYERLITEYDDKLKKLDAKIQAGIVQLTGYHAQINLDFVQAKEGLETLEARILIGDEDSDVLEKKAKLTEKTQRLQYALVATEYILQKESTMRNGPRPRFEVTEKTLADSQIMTTEPEEEKETAAKTESESTEPESSQPSVKSDAEAGKICTQCGRVTASEAKFCVHCGAPF